MVGGAYSQIDYVYDIAQLLRQKYGTSHRGWTLPGGSISLLYTALHPENVNKLIAIEGMGPPPSMIAERVNQPAETRLHNWFSDLRKSSGVLLSVTHA
ncbi:MAG: hypothetical protein CM15mP120_26670 [Pseudomonadota bacterium]|nr:MAG: hypothetical protein CM15mP120_26670 [Pseudomonadota bacterium]